MPSDKINPVFNPETKTPRLSALDLNDFEILGLPASFTISRSDVDAAFFKLAPFVHPDRYAGKSLKDRNLADAIFTRLSRARAKLSDPYDRADILIASSGGPTAAQMKTTPPDFLMQVMDLQDRLRMPDADRNELQSQVDAIQNSLYDELRDLLNGESITEVLTKARLVLNKVSYLRKVRSDFSLQTLK